VSDLSDRIGAEHYLTATLGVNGCACKWRCPNQQDRISQQHAAHVAEVTEAEIQQHAERLAAALALVLYDAHPTFGSTAKWHGDIGGQAITSHCALTQGAHPGGEWAEHDLPSKPLREFLNRHPFDLEAAKAVLKIELLADLYDPSKES